MSLNDKLKNLLDEAKEQYFIDDYKNEASYEETLGLLISKFCKWHGEKIFKVSTSAFEDSNFHSFNEKFEELWKETMDKETKEWEQVQV
tara:strand:+ start:495 stop:761 length:267 start_codon:yes stop_codon:yes gene_type:complete